MVKHCDIPRCYLTKKEDKCLSPNPWILHLIQMSGQGFTRKEISQKYRARKEIVKRRTAHLSPSEAKKLANKNMCADIHAGRVRPTNSQLFFIEKPVPPRWTLRSIRPFIFEHDTNLRKRKCKIKFTQGDINRFHPGRWYNDNIIDSYMALLGGSSNPASRKKAYFFNTMFYPLLTHGGSISGYTRGIPITRKDRIFIPVNVHNNHWILVVVDAESKRIQHYNSMASVSEVVLENIKNWASKTYKSGDWVAEDKTSPMQKNGSDCGVFVCVNAALLSNKRKLSYTQNHMSAYRQRIAWSIQRGKLS
ncbi:putative ubiquitin-like putative cysteine protease [Feldmannia species virus]|uniref:Putative ubiquitin-like putative cysteine protease n=1 Tax=Feldmannia species virus TaxID=39420 RepID=B5LWN3_9PHYC|nr:putative ubiquitin-like putative cysteine protease [Feldmannia species virus]ACH46896.1 putative ubiquitin-like putative cysteine protease [Feldmannia species virus]